LDFHTLQLGGGMADGKLLDEEVGASEGGLVPSATRNHSGDKFFMGTAFPTMLFYGR
jgi:hypothetical protein